MVKQFLRFARHISMTLISKEMSQTGVDNLLVMAHVYVVFLKYPSNPVQFLGAMQSGPRGILPTRVCMGSWVLKHCVLETPDLVRSCYKPTCFPQGDRLGLWSRNVSKWFQRDKSLHRPRTIHLLSLAFKAFAIQTCLLA